MTCLTYFKFHKANAVVAS